MLCKAALGKMSMNIIPCPALLSLILTKKVYLIPITPQVVFERVTWDQITADAFKYHDSLHYIENNNQFSTRASQFLLLYHQLVASVYSGSAFNDCGITGQVLHPVIDCIQPSQHLAQVI